MKSVCLRALLLAALLAAPTACNVAPPSPSVPSPTPTQQVAPTQTALLPGKAGFTGRVVSTDGDKPLGSTIVRLAQVYRGAGEEGAFVLDGATSPGAVSDPTGRFTLDNLDAVEYVMVVGDVMDVYVIVSGDNGKARVWTLAPDKYLDVGTIRVTMPK